MYNIYIYIYTHTHTHTHIYIYTHTHIYKVHMNKEALERAGIIWKIELLWIGYMCTLQFHIVKPIPHVTILVHER